MKKWYKRLLRTMGISEQSTLLCEQKLLTSRQIFQYAVPARTVTKKHCSPPVWPHFQIPSMMYNLPITTDWSHKAQLTSHLLAITQIIVQTSDGPQTVNNISPVLENNKNGKIIMLVAFWNSVSLLCAVETARWKKSMKICSLKNLGSLTSCGCADFVNLCHMDVMPETQSRLHTAVTESLLVPTMFLINVFEKFEVRGITGFFHPRCLLPSASQITTFVGLWQPRGLISTRQTFIQ